MARSHACLVLMSHLLLPVAAGSALRAAPPRTPQLNALSTVEPGSWQVDVAGRQPGSLCFSDADQLVQIEHSRTPCSRFVIQDQPNRATVHYSCPGTGWGRTTLTVETPRSVRVETQGISANEPFSYTAQARRTGACHAGR